MKLFLLSLGVMMMSHCTKAQNTITTTDKNKTAISVKQPNTEAKKEGQEKPCHITFTKEDKTKVEAIISKFRNVDATNKQQLIISIARELIGILYVAKTLEVNETEQLVVNLRQLDCTTYVENVLALYMCIKEHKTTFDEYCHYLQKIRYVDGKVAYPTRQHYFTEWIEENAKDGFVEEIQSPNPPFTAKQHLKIDFMSTHTQLYPMLKNNPKMVEPIAKMEARLSGNTYRFIPKASIANTKLFKSTIQDGDIIAITTSKKGLDTSHIGIAVWHKDGLHLLNASQIHKKVVEEPMTLYQYMQKHPTQTGIRIVRVK